MKIKKKQRKKRNKNIQTGIFKAGKAEYSKRTEYSKLFKAAEKKIYSKRGLDKELSHLLFSHQRAVWERSAYSIIAD